MNIMYYFHFQAAKTCTEDKSNKYCVIKRNCAKTKHIDNNLVNFCQNQNIMSQTSRIFLIFVSSKFPFAFDYSTSQCSLVQGLISMIKLFCIKYCFFSPSFY